MVEDGGVRTESLRTILGSGILTALRPATSRAWEGPWVDGVIARIMMIPIADPVLPLCDRFSATLSPVEFAG